MDLRVVELERQLPPSFLLEPSGQQADELRLENALQQAVVLLLMQDDEVILQGAETMASFEQCDRVKTHLGKSIITPSIVSFCEDVESVFTFTFRTSRQCGRVAQQHKDSLFLTYGEEIFTPCWTTWSVLPHRVKSHKLKSTALPLSRVSQSFYRQCRDYNSSSLLTDLIKSR